VEDLGSIQSPANLDMDRVQESRQQSRDEVDALRAEIVKLRAGNTELETGLHSQIHVLNTDLEGSGVCVGGGG